MRYRAALLAALSVGLGSLGLDGCFTAKRQLVLPPLAPVVAKPFPQPEFEDPPEIAGPPSEIPMEAITLDPLPEMETPPPKPVTRRRPTAPPATPIPTTPVTPEVEPPPVPVPTTPQLSEILTEDRRKQIEADLLASVARANEAVKRAAGRRLNERQQEYLQRIKTFLEQAEKSKANDLAAALQLARRADLLGEDLQKSLQ